MTHTPGPWVVEYYDSVRSKANGEFVCNAITYNKYGRTEEQRLLLQEANARLIAAAPDLLEALKKYQQYNRLKNDSDAEIYDIAETAIAKAEGKAVK